MPEGDRNGLKFDILELDMKKKESLWDLLKRLDEQAGQFNLYLHKANHYFDSSATATKKIVDKHEKDLHQLITKVRRALKIFVKKNNRIKKKPK